MGWTISVASLIIIIVVSAVFVLSCGQTDADTDDRFTPATFVGRTVGVSNKATPMNAWCPPDLSIGLKTLFSKS